MKKLLIAVALTAALVASSSLARAADPAAKPAGAAKTEKAGKPGKQMPFKGKVSAVDKVAKSVTLEGKEKARQFLVTSESRINKDGKPALFDDIHVGDSVGGLARANASGEWEIVTLNSGIKSGKSKADDKKSAKVKE